LIASTLSTAALAYEVANAPEVGSKEWADQTNATNARWDDFMGKLLPKGWVTPSVPVQPFDNKPPAQQDKRTAPKVDLDPLHLGRYGIDDMRAGLDLEAQRASALSSLGEGLGRLADLSKQSQDLAAKLQPPATVAPPKPAVAPVQRMPDLDPLGLGRYGIDDMRGGLDLEAQRAAALSSLGEGHSRTAGADGKLLASKLDKFARPQTVKVDSTVTGTVAGEAQLHITVDASGVRETTVPLNLRGNLGQSRVVPSPLTGRAAGPI
jgi:hypothetical protein